MSQEQQAEGCVIEWYRTGVGRVPLREFLTGLDGEYRVEAVALLEMLEKWGNRLRPPKSRALGGGLLELRGKRGVRIVYVFGAGGRAIVLDGIVKKQDKIPMRILSRVRRYQKDVVQEMRKTDVKEEQGR